MPYQPGPWTSTHTGKTYPTITQYDQTHLALMVFFIMLCGILVVAVKKLPGSVVTASRKVAGAIMGIISVA